VLRNIARVAAGQVNDLVARIRDAHVSVVSALNGAIDNAVRAGKLLIEAKKQTPHGQWSQFLERCDVGARQSQRYMKLAELVEANPTLKSDLTGLTIEQAIKCLSPPKTHDRPQPAALKQPGKPSAKTGHTDIIGDWLGASAEERTRALDGIGLKPLLAAIPPAWWPLIEQHLAERQKLPLPTVTATAAIPDDLFILPFLQRATPEREIGAGRSPGKQ
jgi:hypothetical protein